MAEMTSTASVGQNIELDHGNPTLWAVSGKTSHVQERDLLALPERLEEMPVWLQTPFRRFLRLKQRNWPAKTVQRSTRQLFNRLYKMITFFIHHYEWSEWRQITPHWIEDFIDARLREGKAPSTINWDLYNLRVFCRFLIDEGHAVPASILRMKLLDTPRRLPRPLSGEQVRQLECCIQKAITNANTDQRLVLAVRDLTCFYLLWHCGLRISEVCSLLLHEVDIEARKLFIRNSKDGKDRVVYMSDTVALILQQYLAIRGDQVELYLFPTRSGIMTTRTLQRRLVHYGQQCNVPVTAHRLRHTFASQMLMAGMPVTSLQRFLGHEHLDTTMIYAEVADPLLRQDYYQGITALDPKSEFLPTNGLASSHQDTLRQLIIELKMPGLESNRRDEILNQMQRLLENGD
ncbi:MAG: tyrosine-type recombinase/integrase [Anaerolineaceae bacterium]|nr:tyrosine-type recombinase/integrase [Anaerolineaceae bacterium]